MFLKKATAMKTFLLDFRITKGKEIVSFSKRQRSLHRTAKAGGGSRISGKEVDIYNGLG